MKRIYTDIVGDLFHCCHVDFLKKCKSFGDYLIVGVNSDADCSEDKRLPILSSKERSSMVKEMKFVDEVIVDAPYYVTEKIIVENNIDLVIHAHPEEESSYWNEVYKEAVKRNAFKRIDRCEGVSTTGILNKIKERMQNGSL